MDKKTFAKFFEFQKHPAFPFLVGFGIACIHFLITPSLETSNIINGDFLWLILAAPSFIIVFAIHFLSVSKFIDISILDNFSQYSFIMVSSLFYGIVGGLLVSRKTLLQSTAIILFILLIVFVCFLGAMSAQSFA
jgi:hypothetical protein